jgi:hypothetical protein
MVGASFVKVLVIPEDQQLDQYILKPVIERLFEQLQQKARIEVLPEPRLRGGGAALEPQVLESIIQANRHAIDLFLLVVDRDCDRDSNVGRMAAREKEHGDVLIGCLAVEEVETWLLALHRDAVVRGFRVAWNEVRADCDPKEAFAEQLLEDLGRDGPGRGRKKAMRSLVGQWKTLCTLCPEIEELCERVRRWIESNATP